MPERGRRSIARRDGHRRIVVVRIAVGLRRSGIDANSQRRPIGPALGSREVGPVPDEVIAAERNARVLRRGQWIVRLTGTVVHASAIPRRLPVQSRWRIRDHVEGQHRLSESVGNNRRNAQLRAQQLVRGRVEHHACLARMTGVGVGARSIVGAQARPVAELSQTRRSTHEGIDVAALAGETTCGLHGIDHTHSFAGGRTEPEGGAIEEVCDGPAGSPGGTALLVSRVADLGALAAEALSAPYTVALTGPSAAHRAVVGARVAQSKGPLRNALGRLARDRSRRLNDGAASLVFGAAGVEGRVARSFPRIARRASVHRGVDRDGRIDSAMAIATTSSHRYHSEN